MFGLPPIRHRYLTRMSEPSCPGCRQRDAVIADLQRQVADLAARVRDLEQRLATNATNSSLPPSANPPAAPKPVTKPPSGRKPGAQPGHELHLRQRLPAERLTAAIDFYPAHCDRCHGPLPAQPGPGDPAPSWHQVAELPELAAHITEYRGHARTCPGCGAVTHAPVPAALRRHCVGPRLAALLAYLAGCHHVSARGLEELAEAAFGVPLALGTVSNLQGQVSDALAAAHAEAVAAVRAAPVKHVDETGWKLKGKLCWLWLAATARVAAFLVHARRGAVGLAAILGTRVRGILHSDRWSAYGRLPVAQRQVCWAHLIRDFRKCAQRGRAGKRVGQAGLAAAEALFREWHLFRGGGITRRALYRRLDPVAAELHQALERGCGCADAKVAAFCENLLAVAPALWRFVVVEGLEPTNNHAERLLRRGVLWRKNAFGSASARGLRFVERLLSVVQTLRLQQRPVLEFLVQSLVAHRAGLPTPKLLLTR
jgi:transposase